MKKQKGERKKEKEVSEIRESDQQHQQLSFLMDTLIYAYTWQGMSREVSNPQNQSKRKKVVVVVIVVMEKYACSSISK